jgi:monoamine oxidase
MTNKVVIIGAGLTGLTLAYELEKKGIQSTILEARDRIGGRIETIEINGFQFKNGATWLGTQHSMLLELLDQLNIDIISQYSGTKIVYEIANRVLEEPIQYQDSGSYKIEGGSANLIRTLKHKLHRSELFLSEKVLAIDNSNEDYSIVNTDKRKLEAEIVISTLPPNLLINTIRFKPELPGELRYYAKNTHTWMGESIKVGIGLSENLWIKQGIGTVFSQNGPIIELHDHSEKRPSWNGFISSVLDSLDKKSRKEIAIQQLSRLFPWFNESQLEIYNEKCWSKDPFTNVEYDNQPVPHQNNGHPIFREEYDGSRFLLAGSETSGQTPGYMNGAVESGIYAAAKVQK